MKKMKSAIAIALLAAVAAVSLTACGAAEPTASKAENTSSVVESKPTEESKAESKTEESSTPEESSKQEESKDPQVDEAMYDVAWDRLSMLNAIDMIGGGAVPMDETDTYAGDPEWKTYAKVVDDRFSTLAELSDYIHSALTDNMIAGRYSDIEGDQYQDHDGALYGIIAGRGCGFSFQKETLQVYNVTDDKASVSVDYVVPGGAAETMHLEMVNENGTWKIDSFDY